MKKQLPAVLLPLGLAIAACSNLTKSAIQPLPTGLAVVDSATQTLTEHEFGMADEQLAEQLEPVLGKPALILDVEQCGLTFASWDQGLETVHRDGQFVGWRVAGTSDIEMSGDRGLRTKLADLQAANTVELKEVGDHAEFKTEDGYAGTLNGSNPDNAIVVEFMGGETLDKYQKREQCDLS